MSDFALDDPSFYEDFLVEAGEHFELIEQNFLTLEESPGDLEILNAIFRSVHTIKGASGFLGLTKVQALAHIGENVLDDLRKGRIPVSPRVMEVLFETEDTLKVLVNDVGIGLRKQGTAADPDTSGLIARLEALKGGVKAPMPPAPGRREPGVVLPALLAGLDADSAQAAEAALGCGEEVLALVVHLLPEILTTHFNPLSMLTMVDLVGTLIRCTVLLRDVDLDQYRPDEVPFDLVLLVRPAESQEAVEQLFGGVKNVAIQYCPLNLGAAPAQAPTPAAPSRAAAAPAPSPVQVPVPALSPAPAPPPAEPAQAAGPARTPEKAQDKSSDTIRVSQAKLDNFMNTVAELIISKTMISHIVERLETETLPASADDLVKELRKASLYLDQVSKEIQSSVLGIRMVPVKTIFTRFPRMLRDLAKSSGKKHRAADAGGGDGDRQEPHRGAERSADPPDPQQRRPRHRAPGGAGPGRQARERHGGAAGPP